MKNHKAELAIAAVHAALLVLLIVAVLTLGEAASPMMLFVLAATVMLGALTAAALGILMVVRAGQRADRSRWARAEKSLSRLEWLTAKVPDVAGSVGRSREDLKSLLERDTVASPAGASRVSVLESVPVSGAVVAIRAAGPVSAGRGAGSGGSRPENAPRLLEHIGGLPPAPLDDGAQAGVPSRTGVIGPLYLLDVLPPGTEALALLPGTARALTAQTSFDAVLIDDRAFGQGPWAGSLDALGTNLFIELWDVLRHLRSVGVMVVLLRHGRPVSHFTADLESQCSLILDAADYDLELGDGVRLPLLDHVLTQVDLKESAR